MGMGPLGKRFRGECAVRNDGVAVEVGVQNSCHPRILGLGLLKISRAVECENFAAQWVGQRQRAGV